MGKRAQLCRGQGRGDDLAMSNKIIHPFSLNPVVPFLSTYSKAVFAKIKKKLHKILIALSVIAKLELIQMSIRSELGDSNCTSEYLAKENQNNNL